MGPLLGFAPPMMAMAAARNGEPNLAIEALLHPSRKNQFNVAGLKQRWPVSLLSIQRWPSIRRRDDVLVGDGAVEQSAGDSHTTATGPCAGRAEASAVGVKAAKVIFRRP